MDPNAALATLIRLINRINEKFDLFSDERYAKGEMPNVANDAYDLAAAAEALNGWLSNGGFLPDQWNVTTCEGCDVKLTGGKDMCPACMDAIDAAIAEPDIPVRIVCDRIVCNNTLVPWHGLQRPEALSDAEDRMIDDYYSRDNRRY